MRAVCGDAEDGGLRGAWGMGLASPLLAGLLCFVCVCFGKSMYVCICVCVYVCLFVCIYVYVYM